MMKRGAILILLVMLAACAPAEKGEKLKVVASFYPLAYFTEQVGGDLVDVSMLVPAGVGVHDWEPTSQDIRILQNGDVFVYNGIAEFWAESILKSVPSSLVIVKVSEGLSLLEGEEHEEEHEEEEHEEENEESPFDPHIWLDPVLAQHQVDRIAEGLSKADPQHKEAYAQNAAAFKQKLARLDEQFTQGLAECKQDILITSHFAFQYAAERYGFTHESISGLLHEEEPSAQKIAELIDLAKKRNIKYVMFETLISPRVSETIAREIGGQTLVLNPIEGLTPEETSRGENWMTIMEQNLQNLRTALECS